MDRLDTRRIPRAGCPRQRRTRQQCPRRPRGPAARWTGPRPGPGPRPSARPPSPPTTGSARRRSTRRRSARVRRLESAVRPSGRVRSSGASTKSSKPANTSAGTRSMSAPRLAPSGAAAAMTVPWLRDRLSATPSIEGLPWPVLPQPAHLRRTSSPAASAGRQPQPPRCQQPEQGMGRRVVQPVRRAPEPERGIALLRRQERPQTPEHPAVPAQAGTGRCVLQRGGWHHRVLDPGATRAGRRHRLLIRRYCAIASGAKTAMMPTLHSTE